FLVSQITNK
ncbi:ribulose-phosphate 3-epimerase, partial [Vibrio parahaemolyticus 970107]